MLVSATFLHEHAEQKARRRNAGGIGSFCFKRWADDHFPYIGTLLRAMPNPTTPPAHSFNHNRLDRDVRSCEQVVDHPSNHHLLIEIESLSDPRQQGQQEKARCADQARMYALSRSSSRETIMAAPRQMVIRPIASQSSKAS